MKLVVFGTGRVYRENKGKLDNADEITAFLDNDKKKQGKLLDGKMIFSPKEIKKLDYENILLMSDYAAEMKEQLLNLGCPMDMISHYREYFGEKSKERITVEWDEDEDIKSWLIITSELGYHGGAIVAVYAAEELMKRGYRVVVAAPGGDALFINEFQKRGIEFILNQNLPYLKWKKLNWVMNFQKIIVNTYPIILCALEICLNHSVSLWLHESDNIYWEMRYWEDRIQYCISEKNLHIYAVSETAKQNFIHNIIACDIEVLPYGIPDSKSDGENRESFLKFALIGSIHPIKQQVFFLQSIMKINNIKNIQAEFYIIGKVADKTYAEIVNRMACGMEHVWMIGELQRKEMEKMYHNIDVVIVPSVYETMSLVATEAMMNEKVCIVSDTTGIAQYIVSGENGFVFQNGNEQNLAEKIAWCIDHRDQLKYIGKRGREIYENNFTLRKMGDQLEKLL